MIGLLALLALAGCSSAGSPGGDAKARETKAKTETEPKPKPELDVSTAYEPPGPPPLEPEPALALPPRDGFFMAEGAPLPRACTSKTECLGDTIPDLAQPCCNDPRSLEPYARAYREWLASWRRDACADVTCPPPPPPAQPPACAFEVDCVAGRCVDSCE